MLIIWTGTGFDRNRLLDEDVFRFPLPLSPTPAAHSPAVPPDILPAGYFYLLWDFTLTSWTLGRPGNTKATFQSSLIDNGLPCNFFTSPMQEMNSSTGKSNNLRRELRNLGDLTIPFPTIRRSGDEVSRFSSASHPGYHPPAGWQTVTQTWRVIGKRDHLLCFSLGFESSCEKIQYIKYFAKWQLRWRCNWMQLNQNQLAGGSKVNKKITFHVKKNTFSWQTQCS